MIRKEKEKISILRVLKATDLKGHCQEGCIWVGGRCQKDVLTLLIKVMVPVAPSLSGSIPVTLHILESLSAWPFYILVLTQHYFYCLSFLLVFSPLFLSNTIIFSPEFSSLFQLYKFSFCIANPPHAFNYRPVTHRSLLITPASGMNSKLMTLFKYLRKIITALYTSTTIIKI